MINLSRLKNVYKKTNIQSEIISQILYGEKFLILRRYRDWLKIKTTYDDYIGYIKNNNLTNKSQFKKKVSVLKGQIYFLKKNIFFKKKKNFLPFASKINILEKKKGFVRYDKNKWLRDSDLKFLIHKKKFTDVMKLFINCPYKWGGKSYEGIDCSALIQIYYMYNNKFFPRDTKDQIKFKKGFKFKNKFSKGDIIFWKGHVAICINSKNLIHAYGPKKKVLIMPVKKTIKLIKKTAHLDIKKIYKI